MAAAICVRVYDEDCAEGGHRWRGAIIDRSMKHEFPDPTEVDSIVHNPSPDELRAFSADLETETEFGSPAYVSEFRSRSADRTRNAVDHGITDADQDAIGRAHNRLRTEPFVCAESG